VWELLNQERNPTTGHLLRFENHQVYDTIYTGALGPFGHRTFFVCFNVFFCCGEEGYKEMGKGFHSSVDILTLLQFPLPDAPNALFLISLSGCYNPT
jgi:hypothetical protein